jgi:hypothetical protein
MEARTIMPVELWTLILSHLHRPRDQWRCSQVCSLFYHLLAPTLHARKYLLYPTDIKDGTTLTIDADKEAYYLRGIFVLSEGTILHLQNGTFHVEGIIYLHGGFIIKNNAHIILNTSSLIATI